MPGLSLSRALPGPAGLMSDLPIIFHWSAPDRDGHRHVARLAGIPVDFPIALPELETRPERRSIAAPMWRETPTAIVQRFSGEGWLHERLRAFRSDFSVDGQSLSFEAGGALHLSADGNEVHVLHMPDAITARNEFLFGPCLLLAMAARGLYALHAAAIAGTAGAVLLVGVSGAGKSTLARLAPSYGLRRLADDVVPVSSGHAGFAARPRFPQLKLSPPLCCDDQVLPIAGLVWVEPVSEGIALLPRTPAEANRLLLRDTVAARLFGPERLAAHLNFAAALAAGASCWVLQVPRVAPSLIGGVAQQAYALLTREGLL